MEIDDAPEQEWDDPYEALNEELAEADLEQRFDLAEGAVEAMADLIGLQVRQLQDAQHLQNKAALMRDLLESAACQLIGGVYTSQSDVVAEFRVSGLVERFTGPFDVDSAAIGVSNAEGISLAEAHASFIEKRDAGVAAHAAIEAFLQESIDEYDGLALPPLPTAEDAPYAGEIALAAKIIDGLLAEGGILVAVEVSLMSSHVGGTFDALMLMPTGHCTIIDWKRRAKLESALFNRKGLVPTSNARATLMREKGFAIGDWAVPLSHLTQGDETAFKMSMYARMVDEATKLYTLRRCRTLRTPLLLTSSPTGPHHPSAVALPWTRCSSSISPLS